MATYPSVWAIDANGDWTDAGDWFTYVPEVNPPNGYNPWQPVVPGLDDDVNLIPTSEPSGNSTGTSPFTLTYNTTDTINSLSSPVYATFDLTGGDLTVVSTINMQGPLNISGGKLDIENTGGAASSEGARGANYVLLPSLDLTGGTLEIDAGSLGLVGANTISGGVVSGAGDFYVTGYGSLAIDSGADITASTFELGVSPNGTTSSTTLNTNFSYTGNFLLDDYSGNNATLNLNGFTLTLSGTSTYEGTINGPGELLLTSTESAIFSAPNYAGFYTYGGVAIVNQGVVTQDDATQFDDSLDNQSGATYNFTTNGGINNSGSLSVTNEGLLEKTGGTGNSTIDAAFTSSGTINVVSGTIAVNGSGGTLSGTIEGMGGFEIDSNGTYTLGSNLSLTVSTFNVDVNNSGSAEVILSTSFIYSGTFDVGSQFVNTNLDLAGHTLTLAGSATFTGAYGYVNLIGGTSGAGTLLIAQNATATMLGLEIDGGVTLENAGTITANINNDLDADAGASGGSSQSLLQNDSSGVIDIVVSGDVFDQEGTSGLITNAGKIDLTAAVTGESDIYIVLNSTGTLESDAGTLFLHDGGTIGGTLSGDGTIVLGGSGTAYTLSAGLALDVSYLNIEGSATVTLGQSFSYGGTFYEGGQFSDTTLDLAGYTLTLTNAATLTAPYGYVNLTGGGTLKIAQNATAAIDSTEIAGGVTLENAGTITDNGHIFLDADAGASGGSVQSLFKNDSTGVVDIVVSGDVFDQEGTSGLITNAGKIDLMSAVTGESDIYVAINSAGTLESDAGVLFLHDGGTIGGALSGAGTIVLGGSGTAYTLSAGLALNVSYLNIEGGATVTLGQSFSYAGTFYEGGQFSDTTLDLAGYTLTLTNAATLTAPYDYVNLTGGGTLKIAQNATAAIDSTEIAGGVTLENAGTITDNGHIFLDADAGASGGSAQSLFKNDSTGVIDIVVSGDVFDQEGTSGLISNAGKIDLTSAVTGEGDIYVALNSTGTLESDAGTLALHDGGTLGGKLSGAGTLALVGGAFTISSGANVSVANWSLSGITATLDGNLFYTGSFSLSNATLSLTGGYLILSGSASLSGTVNGSNYLYTEGATSVSGLTIGGTAEWENTGTVTQSGGAVTLGDSSGATAILYNASKGVYEIADASGIGHGSSTASYISNGGLFEKTSTSGTSVISASFYSTGTIGNAGGDLEFDGPQTHISGTYVGPGMIDYGPDGVTTLGAINITASACGTNYGVVNVTGTLTFHDGSTFTNDGGANFDFAADVGLALASGSSNPSFTNDGTLAKTAGTGVSDVAIDVNNYGVVAADTGTLEFSGPTDSFGGTIQGAGTVLFGGGASTINSGAKLSASTWAISGTGTSVTLGENLAYGGSFSEAAGATLSLTGGYLVLFGGASLAGTVNGSNILYTEATTTVSALTIGGTAEWENTGSVTQSGGAVTVGDSSGATASLYNTSKGTYAISDNSGIGHGSSTASYIANSGLFEKTGGTGTSAITASFLDAGTVTVASGTLLFAGRSNRFAGAVTGAGTLVFAGGVSAIESGATLSVSNWSIAGTGTAVALLENLSYAGRFSQGAGSALGLGANTLTLTGTSNLAGGVSGTGTLALAGGSANIASGAALSVSKWSISGTSTSVALSESLSYAGAFSEGAGSTLSLTGGYLVVAGAASLAGTLNGSNRLYTEAATTASGFTIGGTDYWENTGFATQSGGAVTVGDSSNSAAVLFNASKATYDIAENSGIGHGSSLSSYINNAGLFEKTGGTGTSTISPLLVNSGTVSVSSGLLDISGAVSGTGNDTISGASTLEFDSTLGSGQTIDFTGSGGQLNINSPQGFLGKISNFGASDTLEVAGPWVFEGFTQQTGMGTLNFANGGTDIAITLLGTYTGSFGHAAGPNGSTLITYT